MLLKTTCTEVTPKTSLPPLKPGTGQPVPDQHLDFFLGQGAEHRHLRPAVPQHRSPARRGNTWVTSKPPLRFLPQQESRRGRGREAGKPRRMSQRGLQLTHSGSVSLQRGARATTTCLHLVSKHVCTRYNLGIFANYTALPFLAKLPRREQGTKCPQMIQPRRCLPAFTSRSPLPKGLVKAGKLPSTFTWACRYPKLPSTALNCFSSQREEKNSNKKWIWCRCWLTISGTDSRSGCPLQRGNPFPPFLFHSGKANSLLAVSHSVSGVYFLEPPDPPERRWGFWSMARPRPSPASPRG